MSPSVPAIHEDWVPKVDKNPFYRTTDILNGIFKKRVRLDKGPMNCTDLSTIWVNFSEKVLRPVVSALETDRDKFKYALQCGHEWSSKREQEVGKEVPCWGCGAAQSYLGFEHEWQHIIFKTNLIARKMFVEQYAKGLTSIAPNVPAQQLEEFLALLINAFDDIRCNGLWEKVYPGSAQQIWERWRRLSIEHDDWNDNFISFVFAVCLQLPVSTSSKFYSLLPVVEWGVQKAKYRGFMNMLVDVRVVLDRCMGTLLSQMTPPPPPDKPSNQASQQQQGSPPQQQEEDTEEEEVGPQGVGGEDAQEDLEESGQEIPKAPSASDIDAEPQQYEDALQKLMSGAKKLDDKEEHKEPDKDEVRRDPASNANSAMVMGALNFDITDLEKLDKAMPSDEADQDMQQQLGQLQDGQSDKSQDSKLMGDAKSKILFVDVAPSGIDPRYNVELTEDERAAVERMRTVFFRTLGKQKAKRGVSGVTVDVPALISYRVDHQDPEVFENDAAHQGFAYHILTDMSGSMQGSFGQVCHASEMLKSALDFPFVTGNLWGFRGPDLQVRRGVVDFGGGEVWIYRYDNECKGYIGYANMTSNSGSRWRIPVECGGLTPMNAALRVSQLHVRRNLPQGVAKRMFLLTDGSPLHTRTTGQQIPEFLLRQFVAKEINEARSHNIEVYVLVLGENSIGDAECKQMFGSPRYWKKVSLDPSSEMSIHRVLTSLVLENFKKYIGARG